MVLLSMKMVFPQLKMGKDVVTFLSWAAEPEMEERKLMGFKWIFVLSLALLLAVYYRRMKWSPLESWAINQISKGLAGLGVLCLRFGFHGGRPGTTLVGGGYCGYCVVTLLATCWIKKFIISTSFE